MTAQGAPAHQAVAAGTWTLTAGTAGFDVRDKLVATVHGTIPVTSGSVEVGPDGVAGTLMELDLAGIATGNARRDKDLAKKGLLDLGTHPTMVVRSTRIDPEGDGWLATCELTARGRTAPLSVRVEPLSIDDDEVRVRVTGTFDRTPLQMRAPTFIIGRLIRIEVNATFRRR